MRLIDIIESNKPMTITSVGQKDKSFDSKKAQAIVDPRGYFAKNKKSIMNKKIV